MTNNKILSSLYICLSLSVTSVAGADEELIIQCAAACDEISAAVSAAGGTLTYRYENIEAVAATVPSGRLQDLMENSDVAAVYKDTLRLAPDPGQSVEVAAEEIVAVLSGDELTEPLDYLFDNDMTGASVLHNQGILGSDVIVAVIDSGTANVPVIDGAVIGGESFVAGADEPSATSSRNAAHGTWVGTTIAANAAVAFAPTSYFGNAVLTHAPGSAFLDPGSGAIVIPMVGSAPGASLYALKTFPASGGGAPNSVIIAAMDRAITLKKNYDAGMPSVPVSGSGAEGDPYVYDSLNIQVVNMSLGGPTLFAGHDLEDSLTEQMLELGMVLTASAGNSGHSAMTVGSPGTGRGSLTVAAASTAEHERIRLDAAFGPDIGAMYRPTDHVQTATFSSRGPNADGRTGPNVTANGDFNLTQGPHWGIWMVSGTSFSAPTVAGAAALLLEAEPARTAEEVRQALIDSANPLILGDHSAAIEQGAGFIDIPLALDALQSGKSRKSGKSAKGGKSAKSSKSAKSKKSAKSSKSLKSLKDVSRNIEKAGYDTVKFRKVDGVDTFTTHISNLVPGQVAHFFVESKKDSSQILVSFDNVSPELPPTEQNAFFGDDLLVHVADAPTSIDDLLLGDTYINAPASYAFDNPQTGIVRVAVMGDWTNAGMISTDLTIQRVKTKEAKKLDSGEVEQGELDTLLVDVPVGTSELTFELSWSNNWGVYPTDDLDMILISPDFALNFDGATLSSPERVVVSSPKDGTWTVLVDGYTVHGVNKGPESKWELRVTDQDGVSLE